jgi:YNFM family putative membrane transporter
METSSELQLLKRIKLGIFLSGLCVFAQLYLFQPLLPQIVNTYKISPSLSSWTVSAATIGMALGLFKFSFKADALPRKKLMVRSIIGASVITIITPWLPYFELLILASFFKGYVLSGVTAVALAYLSEEVKLTHLGLVIGLYLSGNTVGGMIGRTFTLLISEYLNWKWAVSIVGLLCVVLGLLFNEIFPSSRHFTTKQPIYKLKKLKMFIFLKHKQLISLYVLAAIIMSCFVAIYNYLSFELVHVYKINNHWVAAIFLMYSVGVYASYIAGKWSDKYKSQHILPYIMLLYIMGEICFLIPYLSSIIIGLICITFAFFAAHTLATKLVSQSVLNAKSTATSLYWLFYYIGSSAVGVFAGKLYASLGWDWMIIVLLIMLSIGFFLTIFLYKNYKMALTTNE